MSSSIAIPPPRRGALQPHHNPDSPSSSLSSDLDPSASSISSSSSGYASSPLARSKNKGKSAVRSAEQQMLLDREREGRSSAAEGHRRRPSLLSSSLMRTEHVVVDIGDEEGARLITCVKASQGFDWNQEIFFPSYMGDFDALELEHRQEPVMDIVLTEEELRNMLPS